jgi:hypothetical protein
MTAFAVFVAATCLPLLLLTRWTLEMKPGGGPQGGEALFAGWLLVALWLTLVTAVSGMRHAAGSPALVRWIAVPIAVVVGSAIFFTLVFWLLNDSSLVETPRSRGKAEIWLATALVFGLIAANVLALLRRR